MAKKQASAKPLVIEQWQIDEIIPYEKNPRIVSQDAIDRVATSLKEFGWKQPLVVDSNGVLIAGHTRLQAAKKLAYETAPVIVANDLTPAAVRAYRIADNKLASLTDWNQDILLAELLELSDLDFDLNLTGFDQTDIDALANPASEEEAEDGQGTAKNSIKLTDDQFAVFLSAATLLRQRENDTNISDGRCAEFFAENYRQDPNNQ